MRRSKVKSHDTAAVARLRSAILCDEIRREDNGKLFIIGCYTDGVVASQRPALLILHVLLLFDISVPGSHHLEYRISAPGAGGTGGVVTAENAAAGVCVAAVAPVPCFAEAESPICLEWRVDEGDWSEPLSWRISFAPNAAIQPPEAAEAARAQFSAIAKMPAP
jgi:hypothetical protein